MATKQQGQIDPPKQDAPAGTILIPPWARGEFQQQQQQGGWPLDGPSNQTFITERSRVHETYILETEKTKRWGYGLAAILLAFAFLVPVFAPAGRETVSYMVGLALLIFSAGTVGYTRVALKGKKRSADFDGRPPPQSK